MSVNSCPLFPGVDFIGPDRQTLVNRPSAFTTDKCWRYRTGQIRDRLRCRFPSGAGMFLVQSRKNANAPRMDSGSPDTGQTGG